MAMALLKQAVKRSLKAVVQWRVPRVRPRILRTLPHNRDAFTQGLAYVNGELYESCGGRPDSSLRHIDLRDGRVRKTRAVSGDFAEGIAHFDGLLYQLSWKSERARVYSVPDLKLVRELAYQGEGWGLCSGSTGLAMSNGTGTLRFLDGALRVTRSLRVTQNRLPTRRLNDLEWVGDSLYANVLFSSDILEISAASGAVTRIIDCSALVDAAAPDDTEHCLNGFAYNSDSGTFLATGKCWPLLFELDLFPTGEERRVPLMHVI